MFDSFSPLLEFATDGPGLTTLLTTGSQGMLLKRGMGNGELKMGIEFGKLDIFLH